MKEVIQSVIQREITKGCVFDAHAIIEYLLKNESDTYLSSYNNEKTTEIYHSVISKTIASFEGSIIERTGESWSMNIHKEFSKNLCWKKL